MAGDIIYNKKYQIINDIKLGNGSFGEVYLVENINDKKQ